MKIPNLGEDHKLYLLGHLRNLRKPPLIHYWIGSQGEKTLWAFTSLKEAQKFIERRVDRNQAFLDLLENGGSGLLEGEEFGAFIKVGPEALSECVIGLGISKVLINAGSDEPNSRLYRVPEEFKNEFKN